MGTKIWIWNTNDTGSIFHYLVKMEGQSYDTIVLFLFLSDGPTSFSVSIIFCRGEVEAGRFPKNIQFYDGV